MAHRGEQEAIAEIFPIGVCLQLFSSLASYLLVPVFSSIIPAARSEHKRMVHLDLRLKVASGPPLGRGARVLLGSAQLSRVSSLSVSTASCIPTLHFSDSETFDMPRLNINKMLHLVKIRQSSASAEMQRESFNG